MPEMPREQHIDNRGRNLDVTKLELDAYGSPVPIEAGN